MVRFAWTIRPVPIPPRLRRTGREVAVFVGTVFMLADLFMFVLGIANGDLQSRQGWIFDLWDVLKYTSLVAGMFALAIRTGSRGSAGLAVIFALIGIEDQVSWHATAARVLADRVNLVPLQRLIEADLIASSELVILAVLAILTLALVRLIPEEGPSFRRVRGILTLGMIVLFTVVIVLDLVASNASNGLLAELFEETAERLTLSLIAGYVAGLVVSVHDRLPIGNLPAS